VGLRAQQVVVVGGRDKGGSLRRSICTKEIK